MKKTNKVLAAILAVAAALSISACGSRSAGGFGDVVAPEIDVNAETGTIKYLTYESNFLKDSAEMIALFEQRYGGQVEADTTATSLTYFEMLASRIAAGDSPDLVRYEWISFPHGMSYNMFTPLDTYIDLDSDLWSGIKNIADQYAYNGKHFYVPYHIGVSYALNYNNLVLEENGMKDPMEMVKNNTWTWSAFEEMLKRWKDIDPENHIGYNGVGAMSFVITTGQKVISIQDGEIINNLRNSDIQRCMSWLEKMRKNGLLGATAEQQENGAVSGFVAPDQAFLDGNLLFLGMGADWTFSAAKEALDSKNIPNDIKFVPFPRDEQADAYYQNTDTFGYMIPAGAKNIKGALDWINMLRAEEINPDNIAKAKDEALDDSVRYFPICSNNDCGDTVTGDSKGRHMFTDEENKAGIDKCPICGTARREKYKVVWSEEQYDLMLEMKGEGDKFVLLFDNCYGFSNDVSNLFNGDEGFMDGPMLHDQSYTSLVESKWSVIEGYLQPYRDRMKGEAK